jgi:hypothetical protein
MEIFDSGRIAINADCRQAGLMDNSPKHGVALDRLPFQGFARRSGIQVFRLYSRPSPVTDRKICGCVGDLSWGDVDSCRDVPQYKVVKYLVFGIISSSLLLELQVMIPKVDRNGGIIIVCMCMIYPTVDEKFGVNILIWG